MRRKKSGRPWPRIEGNPVRREILIHPDSRLKDICAPIVDMTDQLRTFADDLLETMYAAPGIGLAAPQVGVLERVIVMDCDRTGAVVMFNPEIISASDETNTHVKICLSIPGQREEVVRPETVHVSWIDSDGVAQERVFDGLWATCVQHEIDHLDGKLYIDYLLPARRSFITRKCRKFKRNAGISQQGIVPS